MSEITIPKDRISRDDISELANSWRWEYLKGVVDIKEGKVALGGEWHKHAAEVLIENGSSMDDIWGFRLYPHLRGAEAIDYESNLNISPDRGNPGRAILSDELQRQIDQIVGPFVPDLEISS